MVVWIPGSATGSLELVNQVAKCRFPDYRPILVQGDSIVAILPQSVYDGDITPGKFCNI